MKPIEQNRFSSTLYGVKLYIDDIELILSKILSINETYTISDDENLYADIEELKKYKGDNPKIIKIESKNNFNFLFVRIVENTASILTVGEMYNKIAYEIEKIFIKRKNNPFVTYFFNPKNAKNNIIVLFVILGGIYLYRTYYLKEVVDIKQNLWSVIIWFSILLVTLINPNYNGKIELKRRHENNFFKNNKDTLIVAIITAIVTYLLTLI
jgi:hypothetical protein